MSKYMTPGQELRIRTEQLILQRTECQRLLDSEHPNSWAVARKREEIAYTEESVRQLRAIKGAAA